MPHAESTNPYGRITYEFVLFFCVLTASPESPPTHIFRCLFEFLHACVSWVLNASAERQHTHVFQGFLKLVEQILYNLKSVFDVLVLRLK